MRRILYMTVGLPRSGKSTWARNQMIPVVNPDAIRLAVHGKPFDLKHENLVWWTVKIMVESLFKAGHEYVILDATNITKARRDVWISEDWERAFVVFTVNDLETLIARAKATDQEYLIPTIHKMASQYEPIETKQEPCCLIVDGQVTRRIIL